MAKVTVFHICQGLLHRAIVIPRPPPVLLPRPFGLQVRFLPDACCLRAMGVDGSISHTRAGLDGSAQLEGFYSVSSWNKKKGNVHRLILRFVMLFYT